MNRRRFLALAGGLVAAPSAAKLIDFGTPEASPFEWIDEGDFIAPRWIDEELTLTVAPPGASYFMAHDLIQIGPAGELFRVQHAGETLTVTRAAEW